VKLLILHLEQKHFKHTKSWKILTIRYRKGITNKNHILHSTFIKMYTGQNLVNSCQTEFRTSLLFCLQLLLNGEWILFQLNQFVFFKHIGTDNRISMQMKIVWKWKRWNWQTVTAILIRIGLAHWDSLRLPKWKYWENNRNSVCITFVTNEVFELGRKTSICYRKNEHSQNWQWIN